MQIEPVQQVVLESAVGGVSGAVGAVGAVDAVGKTTQQQGG